MNPRSFQFAMVSQQRSQRMLKVRTRRAAINCFDERRNRLLPTTGCIEGECPAQNEPQLLGRGLRSLSELRECLLEFSETMQRETEGVANHGAIGVEFDGPTQPNDRRRIALQHSL